MIFYLRVPRKGLKIKKVINSTSFMDPIALNSMEEYIIELKQNPFAFFEYLKICKSGYGCKLSHEQNPSNIFNIKTFEYYEVLSFKIFICELIYHAINMFPDISEYTITCEGDYGSSSFKLGSFEEQINETNALAKVSCTELGIYNMPISRDAIKNIYMCNRYPEADAASIHDIIAFLHMGNGIPKVSTSYVSNKISKLKYK